MRLSFYGKQIYKIAWYGQKSGSKVAHMQKKFFFLLKYKTDVGTTHCSKVLVNASLN